MKVKNKIFLAVIPMMIIFAIASNAAFGLFFKNFVLNQEQQQVEVVSSALTAYLIEHKHSGLGRVNDWGHWDDTYEFISAGDPSYIENNLGEATFENLSLSFMLILDNNGIVLYQQYFSQDDMKFIPFPSDFVVSEDIKSILYKSDDYSSILKISDSFYFVHSSDVTDSTSTTASVGKMIMGRSLDSGIIATIESMTGSSFQSINLIEDAESVFASGEKVLTAISYSDSNNEVHLKLSIADDYRVQDSFFIETKIPRTMYMNSMRNYITFGTLNTLFFVLVTFILIIFLTNFLSKPFEKLLREVHTIDTSKEKYTKLEEIGDKEFHYLRKSVNSLLVKIEENQDRIVSLAMYDQLTGIPNRTLFSDILQKDISLSSRTGKMLAVIFIDLDDFKSVNDTLGHDFGDELIRQVSQRLLKSVRKHDTVSRFGGDEFLLILNNLSEVDDLQKKVSIIMQIFSEPFILNEMEYFVSGSIGVSIYPLDGDDADSLIKNADIAMYHSKNNGKNAFSFSSQMMKEDLSERIELTNFLYRALDRGEFEVYYQPQLLTDSKRIVGFEALLRWNHPLKGQLLPGKFIRLAEQTRLINPIGKWVLESVCNQIKRWNDMGYKTIRVAVNVSLIQFLDPDFLNIVKQVINDSKINPSSLEIELTESIATNKSINIEPILRSLKEIGVLIAIDDFGTEYSSLTRLKDLSIDRIKMDMQFVHSISKSEKDDAIAKIIILLAKNLNLNIIAEGIETERQMNFLSVHACDEVQGFLYYKPMCAEDAEKLLLEQNEITIE